MKKQPKPSEHVGKISEEAEAQATKQKARASLSPSVSAALVTQAFQGDASAEHCWELIDEIQRVVANVRAGKLQDLEAMLVAQSIALQAMFTNITVSNAREPHRLHKASNLVLALKAQNQSRAAIATLVALKCPKKAMFVRQTNIAAGAQQVNNAAAVASRVETEKKMPPQSKLLKARDGKYLGMVAGAPKEAERRNSAMGAMGKIDRAKKS